MDSRIIIIISIAYLSLLFLIAYFAEKREKKGQSLVNNSVTYALSLAVYCTAWTYYGSVGRATTSGIGFLPIYLGPVIFAPLWWVFLKKIIYISKSQRITSIADFISSRYGKSTWLGIIATLIAVLGIIPYISIQLKAIANSFNLLRGSPDDKMATMPFYLDSALYIAIVLAIFTILFGTRNLDPNERHSGLIAAIAFESILKLIAFLSVGLFICFGLYDGIGDLFTQAFKVPHIEQLFDFDRVDINGWEWFWLLLISMSAILLLPRQFHVAVVENTHPDHVGRASWLFPVYLLLINIFVIPIAIAGLMLFPEGQIEADTYVLNLPLSQGKNVLALFVALGGFSAATSMVIVAVIALSIMIGNNLVLPLILRVDTISDHPYDELNTKLLGIRRTSIVIVLLLAYAYFKAIGEQYTLVSVGLISFTAIAQFLPTVIGGIYWKRGTKKGAIAGLLIGFIIWVYTLPLPTLVETGLISAEFVDNGLWGMALLKPHALFGLEGSSHIANAAFWSLSFNTTLYILVSLNTTPSPLELTQADLFVDIYKYKSIGNNYEVVRRQAKIKDVRLLLQRFLGERRTLSIFKIFEQLKKVDLSKQKIAEADLVNYAETHLAGAIGAASAKVIIGSITKEEPITLEEMFKVLEQTQEIIQYSKALEKKSTELEQTTRQLTAANEKLKELDDLKAEFIATVTHELRTPITSIRSLSKIILDNPDLDQATRKEFLNIVVKESERLSRLINQVLDIEKLQSNAIEDKIQLININALSKETFNSLKQLMNEKGIEYHLDLHDTKIYTRGNPDRLKQAIINLLSNAIKFCHPSQGAVSLSVSFQYPDILIKVQDNGNGIPIKEQQTIFQKFTQIKDDQRGKPQGSGLGLFITKSIVEEHQGRIWVQSTEGKGATFYIELPSVQKETDRII
jgi:Na+/proline symporter/signal transduction histidine kinase